MLVDRTCAFSAGFVTPHNRAIAALVSRVHAVPIVPLEWFFFLSITLRRVQYSLGRVLVRHTLDVTGSANSKQKIKTNSILNS